MNVHRIHHHLLKASGFIFVVLSCLPLQADDILLNVDFSVPIDSIRPLHGINKGPMPPGGLFDVIQEQKQLGIPFTRLHDCGWPNPYVVDHHAVFPDPEADPALPESYDFRLTDEYIDAVRKTGAEPIYRLGESIEHTSVKRYVHPPADSEKWAAVCIGIIRHYNEGWANGFHHNIRYWEIWNEPENRPAMWSGTDEDYLHLYRTAASAIKRRFPSLKVGGPALGASGSFDNGQFIPTDFAVKFLAMCRNDHVPLDFFSWHCYTADPSELVVRARAIRQLLDQRGFTETESHLNEWNFLPGNTWEPLTASGTPIARQRYYSEMAGPPGAAFIAAALLELQNAPVDVCNFFHGELGGFGIFNEQGVPLKNYQALHAIQSLLETPRRVQADGAVAGKLAIVAGLSTDNREATILISNLSDERANVNLQWKGFNWTGGVTAEIRTIDSSNDFSQPRTEVLDVDESQMQFMLKAPAVAMIRLRPTRGATAKPTLSITSPANRLVFQRSRSGNANIHVAGKCAWPGADVEARLIDVVTGKATEWTPLGTVQTDLRYGGNVPADGGWYTMEVRAHGDGNAATASVNRVGVGEVFVVVGHSVAHGADVNLRGAVDDRVNTIALPEGDVESQRQYRLTGESSFLPLPLGSHFAFNVRPAPVGNGTYFWAAFAEHIVKSENVPVLILNAAFGGTSLEHWAKSARGEPFEHSFVNASIRMPYARLEHALKKYCSVTGLRAILADHGQNDWPENDETKIFMNYQAWIQQVRSDANFPNLAVVVNRQSPPDGLGQVRRVQERIIKELSHCYPGPDYDLLQAEDTTDKVHLSESGAKKAGQMWANALDSNFFMSAIPLQVR